MPHGMFLASSPLTKGGVAIRTLKRNLEPSAG